MTPSSEELLSCCVYVFDCVCLYTVSIMKYQVVAIQKNKQKSFVFFVPRQRETYRLTSLVCHVVAPLRGAGARRALTSTAPRAHGRRGAAQNDTRSPGDHARRTARSTRAVPTLRALTSAATPGSVAPVFKLLIPGGAFKARFKLKAQLSFSAIKTLKPGGAFKPGSACTCDSHTYGRCRITTHRKCRVLKFLIKNR